MKVKQDILELKNGSQIRGKLLEQGENIRIQTQDGSIWVYKADEIQQISSGLNPMLYKAKGFINMSEIGVLSGANDENNFNPQRFASFSFRSFNGYQFHHAFALGLTLGADWYEQVIITPIAIGIRGDLSSSRITPFYSLDIGTGSAWMTNQQENESAKGGTSWGIGLGLKIRMPSQTAFTFSLGYHEQNVSSKIDFCNWWGCSSGFSEKRSFNRLALRMGFSF
jgi:hypothetical protein